MRSANLAAKFLLELAALAAFGYWGSRLHGTAVAITAAVLAPLAAAVAWGLLAAPKSPRRLDAAARIPFELAVFALAAVSLGVAQQFALAAAFGSAVALNSVLLTRYRQWDR